MHSKTAKPIYCSILLTLLLFGACTPNTEPYDECREEYWAFLTLYPGCEARIGTTDSEGNTTTREDCDRYLAGIIIGLDYCESLKPDPLLWMESLGRPTRSWDVTNEILLHL